LRRKHHRYDADENSAFVCRAMQLFTAGFFAARAGSGDPAPDPIFIVGMPLSGSTLLEQILASHPLVEGPMELPTLPAIVMELAGRHEQSEARYLDSLAALSPADLRELGARYLAGARLYRKTDAPYFIDKMPNNC